MLKKFLKNDFPKLVKAVIPSHVSLQEVELWFQDEIRIGQQGSLSRLWAEKGTRPRVVRQKQFLYQYLYGAVCPTKEKAAAIVALYADGRTLQIHLEEIAQHIDKGKHGVVILDQSGGHICKDVKTPNNLSLLFLPPYSPELNPQEMVWEALRNRFLHNRVYESLEEIAQVACNAWNKWIENPKEIKSLCQRKWAIL